ncbi:MAG: mechanosensitive ion channel family protein [Alphaproteobacteria bacterium]|nr:mechanosensitive ion channel family protein [Alphaproteobacteria bacterium]
MQQALVNFKATFGPEALSKVFFAWVPGLLAACVTGILFYGIVWVVTRALDQMFQRSHLDPTAATFIRAVTRFVLSIVGVLTALSQMGIDTTSILTSLGVMGLTIGFAAQNTLSNLISGIFIFWDRPFVIGDLIEVDGEYGRVETITLRSTRLVTVDGRMLAIPNAVIANEKVASYTNFPHLRIDVEVTVGVNEPIGRVREILLGLCEAPQYLRTPAPQVVVKSLNDYNVLVELRVWIDDEKQHVAERFALRERVKDALDAAKVEMPFETIQLAPITLVGR